ncbi:hypothetical protein IT399_00185 [Candidatus Nomurabacteria bacterium]|nr:hypothetical protein [Candidatus Nomurabacteria bacterium]
MSKFTSEVKNKYESLAVKFSILKMEGREEEAVVLQKQLAEIRKELGMTAEEIIYGTPE